MTSVTCQGASPRCWPALSCSIDSGRRAHSIHLINALPGATLSSIRYLTSAPPVSVGTTAERCERCVGVSYSTIIFSSLGSAQCRSDAAKCHLYQGLVAATRERGGTLGLLRLQVPVGEWTSDDENKACCHHGPKRKWTGRAERLR